MEKIDDLLEKIDIIFFKLKDEQKFMDADAFTMVFLNKHIPIKKEKIIVILDFLYDERYVERKQIHPSVFEYRINIKGLTFDGFKNKRKIDIISDRNKYFRTLLLTYGTAAAGMYGIFEILKWLFHHEHWRLFF